MASYPSFSARILSFTISAAAKASSVLQSNSSGPFLIQSTETSASDSSESSSSSTETDYSTDSSLTVKDGDKVNIDYVGYIDGKAFDGGDTQGQGTDLTIGSGSYIDDFEDQLIGAHPGDKVEVKVTFPENYGNDELNGKEATFKVTVNGIYE